MTNQPPILLILDLDETLIHSTCSVLDSSADSVVGPYFVYRRPQLHVFLNEIKQHFRLAIWSSASADYVSEIVKANFPKELSLEFIWSRERCIQRRDFEKDETFFVKDLKKLKRLGYSLDRILVVEDTPNQVERNYGNAIYIPPFLGDQNDNELLRLTEYLKQLKSRKNVRQIEKRGWRNHF